MKYNTYIIPDKNGDWLIVPRKGFPLKWPYERLFIIIIFEGKNS